MADHPHPIIATVVRALVDSGATVGLAADGTSSDVSLSVATGDGRRFTVTIAEEK